MASHAGKPVSPVALRAVIAAGVGLVSGAATGALYGALHGAVYLALRGQAERVFLLGGRFALIGAVVGALAGLLGALMKGQRGEVRSSRRGKAWRRPRGRMRAASQ
jgi:hypothetical protein